MLQYIHFLCFLKLTAGHCSEEGRGRGAVRKESYLIVGQYSLVRNVSGQAAELMCLCSYFSQLLEIHLTNIHYHFTLDLGQAANNEIRIYQ